MSDCPNCDANAITLPGTPKIKAVPAHVDPKTCHLAEHLRTLADWLERGDFSNHHTSPDGAAVLLFNQQDRKLTAPPIGLQTNVNTLHDVLQYALGNLQNSFKSQLNQSR